MKNITVPYIDLVTQHASLKEDLLAAVERVLEHGQFILGPEVCEFEQRFAAYCGTRFALGVDNGTSALLLALRALGIGMGDEVITAPNSFLASASAVALSGARPVFADVGEDYNIDPRKIEEAITPKTRAIIPVHLTGRPADMDKILDIARRHGIHVIEDAAQAVGARYRDRSVGSFGTLGCFSLHPLKTLNAVGDGGVITTDDEALFSRLVKARNHGLRNRDECEFWSPNARLDTIQAAMLLVKMDHLDKWTEARRARAHFYNENLRDLVKIPAERSYEYAVYHTYVVEAERRDVLREHLKTRGVDTKIHYPIPIHRQQAAVSAGHGGGTYPVAEAQAKRIVSLPVYPELGDEAMRYVVTCIRDFYST